MSKRDGKLFSFKEKDPSFGLSGFGDPDSNESAVWTLVAPNVSSTEIESLVGMMLEIVGIRLSVKFLPSTLTFESVDMAKNFACKWLAFPEPSTFKVKDMRKLKL